MFFVTPEKAYTQHNFGLADRNANSVSSRDARNPAQLTRALINGLETESEKARAIFTWVAGNIAYDTDAFFRGASSNTDINDVLRNRVAVCEGYANLFSYLAGIAGLQTEIVTGHSKGYGFDAGSDDLSVNHAWVAIYADGEWRLADPTWGAGYIHSENRQFVRRFNDFYFFPEPSLFIVDHFPDDPRWQLLAEEIDAETYREFTLVRPPFHMHSMELRSHMKNTIDTNGGDRVVLGLESKSVVNARLSKNGVDLPTNHIFVQHTEDEVFIDFLPPQRGIYELEIFVRSLASNQPEFEHALSYRIHNTREVSDPGFPEAFAKFIEQRSFLHTPKTFLLDAGTGTEFKIGVPNARSVVVINGSNWHNLSGTDNHLFSGSLELDSGSVQVAARFGNEENYHVLLEYLVK
ncbi:MAG: hypothetical protein LAT67_11780 [Balneolales bacterium]|nr:hypothetical protein [Balneolales bacterium]